MYIYHLLPNTVYTKQTLLFSSSNKLFPSAATFEKARQRQLEVLTQIVNTSHSASPSLQVIEIYLQHHRQYEPR